MMRLINARRFIDTDVLELQRFYESDTPRYLILSHAWGWKDEHTQVWGHEDEEVTFEDVSTLGIGISKKRGMGKIRMTCQLAIDRGLEYVWMDTCCIDKSSSAELAEGINSMFSWYQRSEVCIVYLADFISALSPDPSIRELQFKTCRWFKRGWTLQELIAPSVVVFHDRNWKYIGSKHDFAPELTGVTGIDTSALIGASRLSEWSVATKMSWAANRETRRTEDQAYSLLGIFGVNMPLIYGEGGEKAFRRLQEEISKNISDLSIFAWSPLEKNEDDFSNIFADSPARFGASKGVHGLIPDRHFSITNKGVQMTASLRRVPIGHERYRLFLALGIMGQEGSREWAGIYLRKLGNGIFTRDGTGGMAILPDKELWALDHTPIYTFYIAVSPLDYDLILETSRTHAIHVPQDPNYKILDLIPEAAWDYEERLFFNQRGNNNIVVALLLGTVVRGHKVKLAALFDLRQQPPKCIMFDRNEHKNDAMFMFRGRHKIEPTYWDDLRIDLPRVHRHTHQVEVTMGAVQSQINLSLRLQVMNSRSRNIEMYCLSLDVNEIPEKVSLPMPVPNTSQNPVRVTRPPPKAGDSENAPINNIPVNVPASAPDPGHQYAAVPLPSNHQAAPEPVRPMGPDYRGWSDGSDLSWRSNSDGWPSTARFDEYVEEPEPWNQRTRNQVAYPRQEVFQLPIRPQPQVVQPISRPLWIAASEEYMEQGQSAEHEQRRTQQAV
ncbi:HET-domain-containing protein [Pleurostoma richardsiae]|uniref:HET-domain-containing protein n=1 Tax=Pleurostoma richardsiae TaxID=41990 RepID=A0AA38VK30_9PEZI|nr:HET-domain-containing protein [Pleurostoma richardsiae]